MSKKIIITGDWHSDVGIYTDIAINYLQFLSKYCQKQDIQTIVCTGDVINKSTKVKHESFLPIFLELRRMVTAYGLTLYFIKGNHDIVNDQGLSLFETFKPFATVVDTKGVYDICGRSFTLLSYTKDLTELLSGNNGVDLITHLPISGFKYDNEMTDADSFSIDSFDIFETVYTGHFHSYQKMKNVVYAGSPYQIDFGERGRKKGFLVLDCEGNNHEFITYDKAPSYVLTTLDKALEIDVSNKFVYVEVDRKIDNFAKLRHVLYGNGAIEVIAKYKSEEVESSIDQKEILNMSNDMDSIIVDFIEKLTIDNKEIKKDKLTEMVKAAKIELF